MRGGSKVEHPRGDPPADVDQEDSNVIRSASDYPAGLNWLPRSLHKAMIGEYILPVHGIWNQRPSPSDR